MADKPEVLGTPELSAKFRQLGEGMVKRTGLRMVVAAGQLLKRTAKSIAQEHGLRKSGALIKNIVIKRDRQAPAGTIQYNLGVRHGNDLTKKQKQRSKLAVGRNGRIVKRYEDDPFYWRFPEFGTKKQKKTSYIAAALERDRTSALDAMEKPLSEDLEKAQQQ